jgi:hypothetical protein
MQKHVPLKMIDLELRVREALYAHLSPDQLQALHTGGELDMSDMLLAIAYEVTPRIAYPQTPREVVIQLAELALDCPDLLTGLPVYIAASPDVQHHPIPKVPLKALYINVLDRAIRFGLDECERLAGLNAVPSERARALLWAMEKRYVEDGSSAGFWMRQVLQSLNLPFDWELEQEVRKGVLAELISMGLITLRESQAEIYDLSKEVKVSLVKKHELWEKWDELSREEKVIALAQPSASSTQNAS